jgi:hypothetical protein
MKSMLYHVKQLNHSFIKITQSLVLPHSHRSHMRLLSHWTASVRYLLLTVSSFKSLPVQPLLLIINGSWTYVDRPPVTEASKPNKHLYQKWTATIQTYMHFCVHVDDVVLNIYRRWNTAYCVHVQSLLEYKHERNANTRNVGNCTLGQVNWDLEGMWGMRL